MTNSPNDDFINPESADGLIYSIHSKFPVQWVGSFRVPDGYELWKSGVYVRNANPDRDAPPLDRTVTPCITKQPDKRRLPRLVKIASLPIWLRYFGRCLTTNTLYVQLRTISIKTGQPEDLWAARDELLDCQKLMGLIKHGLHVSSHRARDIVTYFDDAITTNRRHDDALDDDVDDGSDGGGLPWQNVAQRVGPSTLKADDGRIIGRGFLLSKQWIGPPGTNVGLDQRYANQFNKHYQVNGNEQNALRMLRTICLSDPLTRWLVLSSLAAPLLEPLSLRTFIVHHYCQTSGGKTALAALSASLFGNPEHLKLTLNGTERAFEELPRCINGVPLILDELQAASSDLKHFVYNLTGEVGRLRVDRSGHLTPTAQPWKLVVRTTGEQNLVGFGSTDLGGQRNRVLEINRSNMATTDARDVHMWLAEGHYGWVAVRMLEHIVPQINLPQQLATLRTRFIDYRETLQAEFPALGPRDAHLAVIALACDLAFQLPTLPFKLPPAESQQLALDDARHIAAIVLDGDAEETTLSEKALRFIEDHAFGNQNQWANLADPEDKAALDGDRMRRPIIGVYDHNTDRVLVIPDRINELLDRQGLPHRRVWNDLQATGTLLVGKDGRKSVKRQIGKWQRRVYVLKYTDVFPHMVVGASSTPSGSSSGGAGAPIQIAGTYQP